MSDESVVLGKLVCGDQHRDAIHIAIAPVVANERLKPGQRVAFVDGDTTLVRKSDNREDIVGIIDPYLDWDVEKGQKCWLCLYPRSITSLRHQWTHPAFTTDEVPLAKNKESSERWLRDFCANSDCPDYETVLAAATDQEIENVDSQYYSSAYQNDGEYLYFAGRDAHSAIPAEFWDHIETVSGKKIPKRKRARYFSCSC